jgi:hypothetical protein
LVALGLAMEIRTPQILTDSLTSLRLLLGWHCYSTSRVLRCADRVEVRRVLHLAASCERAPVLEKVKAHDEHGIEIGYPKAVGNDQADRSAKLAATRVDMPEIAMDLMPFEDPVLLKDGAGRVIRDVAAALETVDWRRRGLAPRRVRPLLDLLYPSGVLIDWRSSTFVFGRPVAADTTFVHPAPPLVVKWVAKVRAGCLSTRERLHRHRLAGAASAACLCCAAPVEDEEHVLLGCPATGTADWLPLFRECWVTAAEEVGVSTADPPTSWLTEHRWQLAAALIPLSITGAAGLSGGAAARFCKRLHLKLATQLAERMRRWRVLVAAAEEDAPGGRRRPPEPEEGQWTSGQIRVCALPAERQLSPRALRALEVQRFAVRLAGDGASSSSALPRVLPAVDSPSSAPPPSAERRPPRVGRPRAAWLRLRLVRLLHEETTECLVAVGSTAEVLLTLFEQVTGEQFSDSPGATRTSRIRSIAKVLGNLTREAVCTPPLASTTQGGYRVWSRRPRVAVDIASGRQQDRLREAAGASVPRLRETMAGVDAGLADWLRGHRYITPAPVESGESGMALLILWEVNHGRPFPSGAESDTPAARLASFCRRLRVRVAKDDELRVWLVVKEMQFPLAPGLPASHQLRWSVRVERPGPAEPQEWYETFSARWRTYLAGLLTPPTRAAEVPGVRDEQRRGRPRALPSSQSVHDSSRGTEAEVELSRRRPRVPTPAAEMQDEPLAVAEAAQLPPKRRRALPATRPVTPPPLPAPAAEPTQSGLRATMPSRKRTRSPPEVSPPSRRPRVDLRSWLQVRPRDVTTTTTSEGLRGAEDAESSGHGRASTERTT